MQQPSETKRRLQAIQNLDERVLEREEEANRPFLGMFHDWGLLKRSRPHRDMNKEYVKLQWRELHYSDTFLRSIDDIHSDLALVVEGAPRNLGVHKCRVAGANKKNCITSHLKVMKDCATFSVNRDVYETVLPKEETPWKIIWTYFGLHYRLVLKVDEEGEIHMKSNSMVSLRRWKQLLSIAEYMMDRNVTEVLMDSIQHAIDSESVHAFPQDMLGCLKNFIHKNPGPKFSSLSRELERRYLECNPSFLTSADVNWLLHKKLYGTICGDAQKLLDQLIRVEDHLHSTSPPTEYLGMEARDILAELFIKVDYNILNSTKDSIPPSWVAFANKPSLSYSLHVMDRLQFLWDKVFGGVDETLLSRVALVGGMLPMCAFSFQKSFMSHVKLHYYNTSMDVYVSAPGAANTVIAIREYLEKKHGADFLRLNCSYINCLYIRLSTHPLLGSNSSLIIKLFYESSEKERLVTDTEELPLTAQVAEFLLHSYLCVTRACYIPSLHAIFVLPTALRCWLTGTLFSYRCDPGMEPEEGIIRKYVQRRFCITAKPDCKLERKQSLFWSGVKKFPEVFQSKLNHLVFSGSVKPESVHLPICDYRPDLPECMYE